MELYEIPFLFEKIEELLAAGEDTTALVNALVELGPPAIDEYILQIEEKEAFALVAREKSKIFAERARSLEDRAEKMRDFMKDIVNNHFGGKVRTGLGTTWTQKTTSYDFDLDYKTFPQYFTVPEPKPMKKVLTDLVKANALPSGISVTTSEKESLRVRR